MKRLSFRVVSLLLSVPVWFVLECAQVRAQVANQSDSAEVLIAGEAFARPVSGGAGRKLSVAAGTILRATVPRRMKISHLKPNTWIEGELARPVYSEEDVAIPAGNRLRLLVESVQVRKEDSGAKRGFRAAITRPFHLFRFHGVSDYCLTLGAASVVSAEGKESPIKVSFLRLSKPIPVGQRAKRAQTTTDSRREAAGGTGAGESQAASAGGKRGATLMLQLDEMLTVPRVEKATGVASEQSAGSEAEDRRNARAYLLTAVSASKSQKGDAFRAWLAEPVRLGGSLFPEGTIVEGRVSRRVPPRWLSRPGMLSLRVERIQAPLQQPVKLTGSMEAVSVDSGKGLAIDSEGTLHGRKPGAKALLIDLGTTYAIGKIADDSTEAILHVVAANMASTSVAAIARYVGLGSEVAFIVSRRGRDVKLPPYSEVQLEFSRPPRAMKQ